MGAPPLTTPQPRINKKWGKKKQKISRGARTPAPRPHEQLYRTYFACAEETPAASRMQKIRRGGAPGGALGAQRGCTQATLQRRPTGLRRSPLREEGVRLPYERLRQLGLCWFDQFHASGRRRDGARLGPSARPQNAAPLRASYSHGISGQVRAAHAAQNGRGGA